MPVSEIYVCDTLVPSSFAIGKYFPSFGESRGRYEVCASVSGARYGVYIQRSVLGLARSASIEEERVYDFVQVVAVHRFHLRPIRAIFSAHRFRMTITEADFHLRVDGRVAQ